jgi:hypothetical protein
MVDEGLRRALDALSTRLHAEVDRQVHAAFDELAASMPAPREPEPPAVPSPADSAAGERLLAAIQAIGQARSLTEILDALVSRLGVEAQRVGVFLVRGDRLVSWRLAGFDGAAAEGTVNVGLDEAGILAAAVRAKTPVTDETGGDAPSFAKPAGEAVAVPMTLSGEVVAVLYADHGVTDSWRASVEILARYGARCLEVLTAFKVARSMAHPEQADTSAAEHDSGADSDVAEAADVAARRYARLLVSEIKLYHEADVVSGRQARDLATRLGGEIARARSQYEQRVPLPVRQRVDFFHDELVRTLAGGDERLLETQK